MSERPAIGAIPHRPPFLFVDEILEVSDERIVTQWYADPRCDFFRGHYPGRPVMPGVLVCECCFQAGALLIAHRAGAFDASQRVPVVTKIQDARFRRMIRPCDVVKVDVQLNEIFEEAFLFTGRVQAGGAAAARVSFTCTAAEQAEADS